MPATRSSRSKRVDVMATPSSRAASRDRSTSRQRSTSATRSTSRPRRPAAVPGIVPGAAAAAAPVSLRSLRASPDVLSALVPLDTPAPSDVKHFPNPLDTPTVRRASLFRSFVLADYVTCANAVCGVSSIFLCLNYLGNGGRDVYLWWAFALLPLALVFDIADGWVARKRQSFSPWGSDLDSLADVVSFVVSPAVLGFTLGLRGMWDTIALCFFVFCGIARLARFNVTSSMLATGTKVPYYEGFPVPTSLILVAAWAAAWSVGRVGPVDVVGGLVKVLGKDFHPLVLVYVAWGCLFVSSTVRIPKP